MNHKVPKVGMFRHGRAPDSSKARSIACSSVKARPSCQARSKAASSPRPAGRGHAPVVPGRSFGRSGDPISSRSRSAAPQMRAARRSRRELRPLRQSLQRIGNPPPIAQLAPDRQALLVQRAGRRQSRLARRPRLPRLLSELAMPIRRPVPARSQGSPRQLGQPDSRPARRPHSPGCSANWRCPSGPPVPA